MRKALGVMLLVAIGVLARSAKADTFNYTLTDSNNGDVWTWSLTGVPHTLPILPQFSMQVGQPGDILVSLNGGPSEPNVMSLSATTLLFQCDPTLLCGWDEAAEMEFESTGVLLNGTQLLTGNFTGKNVFFWGSGLQLSVTDNMPEISTGTTLLLGLLLVGIVVRQRSVGRNSVI